MEGEYESDGIIHDVLDTKLVGVLHWTKLEVQPQGLHYWQMTELLI